MPCDTMKRTAEERARFEAAFEELMEEIEAGVKKVQKNAFTGEVSISGWTGSAAAREGWCEGCAIVAATQRNPQATGMKWGQKFTAATHNGHSHTVVKSGHGGCGGGH